MTIEVHTDGAARGNPGPAAIAAVIEYPGKDPIEIARVIPNTTNNQAEYQAVLLALGKLGELLSNQPANINFYADSELIVKQINGLYRVKDANLKTVYEQVMAKIDELSDDGHELNFTAVRREFNKRADHLANLALDGKL